jgi:nucleoid-associated protein YgaU
VAGPAFPAGAADADPADPAVPAVPAVADTGGPEALAGLPLPERAEGPAHRWATHVVVHAGDSLWSIAARDLGGRARDPAVTARWHRVYATNRAVIGPDPDLIRPGQVLEIRKDPS